MEHRPLKANDFNFLADMKTAKATNHR